MTEETIECLRSARAGDREAAERMVTENSGLIWSVARRFFGRGVDSEDLYQLGCVGFLKAIEGYDESFGTQFSTYAVPKISGEIRRFLRDDGAVKVSRGIKERAALIRSARTALEQRLGREPTLSELADETGISPEDIAVAETATGPAESLQRERGGGLHARAGARRLRPGGAPGGARLSARGHRLPARAGASGHRAQVFPRHDPGRRGAGHRRLAGAGLAPGAPGRGAAAGAAFLKKKSQKALAMGQVLCYNHICVL